MSVGDGLVLVVVLLALAVVLSRARKRPMVWPRPNKIVSIVSSESLYFLFYDDCVKVIDKLNPSCVVTGATLSEALDAWYAEFGGE